MADLRLSQRGRRFTAGITVVMLLGIGGTMIVLADNNHWSGAFTFAGLLAVALYTFGTPAYRLNYRGPGRIELHTVLGLHKANLGDGYEVKRSWLGKPVVVLRTPKKRFRINGALGGIEVIRAWLDAAADMASPSVSVSPSAESKPGRRTGPRRI